MANAASEKPCGTTDGADPKATFIALSKEYEFHQDIAEKFVDVLEFRSLSDFRYSVTSEGDIKSCILDKCGDQAAKLAEAARVRRAWWGVCSALHSETPKEAALEEMLGSKELATIRENFWVRYKMYLPSERTPGDRLLSRLRRELEKRAITLADVEDLQTQSQQRSMRKVKRRISADPSSQVSIYAEHEQEDEKLEALLVDASSIHGFLELLHMYLVGLGHVGCKERSGKPTALETALTDPVDYLEIPMSLLDKYWWRAVLAAEKYPSLEWLKAQDYQERLMWVKAFSDPANANKSLGVLIQDVYLLRSAHWDVSTLQSLPKQKSGGKTPRAQLKPPSSGGSTGYMPEHGSQADELRDGTRICRSYNSRPGCSKSGCKDAHRCNFMQATGRVCGSWGHIYNDCPQHKRKGS